MSTEDDIAFVRSCRASIDNAGVNWFLTYATLKRLEGVAKISAPVDFRVAGKFKGDSCTVAIRLSVARELISAAEEQAVRAVTDKLETS
jgi:uncharacterized protein YcsI (UPF0317 family)